MCKGGYHRLRSALGRIRGISPSADGDSGRCPKNLRPFEKRSIKTLAIFDSDNLFSYFLPVEPKPPSPRSVSVSSSASVKSTARKGAITS